MVRLDDGVALKDDDAQPGLLTHMIRTLGATEIPMSSIYVWSEYAKDALELVAERLTQDGLRECMRYCQLTQPPQHVLFQNVISCAIDTLKGVTHCVRGEELRNVAAMEEFFADCFSLRRVDTRFVPVLTWQGAPISKSRMGIDVEPETSAMVAIQRYGAERLNEALLESLERDVNDWDAITSRLGG